MSRQGLLWLGTQSPLRSPAARVCQGLTYCDFLVIILNMITDLMKSVPARSNNRVLLVAYVNRFNGL